MVLPGVAAETFLMGSEKVFVVMAVVAVFVVVLFGIVVVVVVVALRNSTLVQMGASGHAMTLPRTESGFSMVSPVSLRP